LTQRLAGLALAGVAVLSFAPSAAYAADSACTLKECVEAVTGPIHVEGNCVWFDTFPVCVPLV